MIFLAEPEAALSISNWLQFGLSTALAIWLLTIEIPRQRKDERETAAKAQAAYDATQKRSQEDYTKSLEAANKAWSEQFEREREAHEKVVNLIVASHKEALQLISARFFDVIEQMREDIKKANGA